MSKSRRICSSTAINRQLTAQLPHNSLLKGKNLISCQCLMKNQNSQEVIFHLKMYHLIPHHNRNNNSNSHLFLIITTVNFKQLHQCQPSHQFFKWTLTLICLTIHLLPHLRQPMLLAAIVLQLQMLLGIISTLANLSQKMECSLTLSTKIHLLIRSYLRISMLCSLPSQINLISSIASRAIINLVLHSLQGFRVLQYQLPLKEALIHCRIVITLRMLPPITTNTVLSIP